MKKVPNLDFTAYRDDSPSPQACPHCGTMLDCATPITSENAPYAGAVSVCIECQGINIFDDDTLLRLPTDAELAELRASSVWPIIQRTKRIMADAQARKNR